MKINAVWTSTLGVMLLAHAAAGQVLYTETFPYPAGMMGNQPISGVGWAQDIANGDTQANRMFAAADGVDGIVYAFSNAASTEAFYTSTLLDTGATGQAFPTIDPTAYQFGVTLFIGIAPTFSPEEVRSRFCVQINGGNWYSSTSILNVPTAASAAFANYNLPFNPAKAGWNNLTVSGAGAQMMAAVIGGPAAVDLVGNITGAGLVVTYGPAPDAPTAPPVAGGGTHEFDNFQIAPSFKPGDVDTDGDTDFADLTIIRTNMRRAVTMRTQGDLTNDNFVNFDDFRQWKANYVPAPGDPADVSVPEPAGALLALTALLGIAQAQRRK